MERTKRMLVVMLASFGIFALLTFLTFSSYGQTTNSQDNAEKALVGAWETELNGETNYFTFNEDNSLIVRSDVFSNSSANTNDKQVGEMSYKINASTTPNQITIYRGNSVMKGVFRIDNSEKISLCLNMEDNDYQPTTFTDDYLIMTLYKVKEEDK